MKGDKKRKGENPSPFLFWSNFPPPFTHMKLKDGDVPYAPRTEDLSVSVVRNVNSSIQWIS